ncbi:MAG: Wzz/FepE/Etk N-terminal domain-containing protein [bacterium]
MEEKKVQFSDYLYILYKWKKLILINTILITLIAVGISYIIPETFKATAVVMIPPENSMGISGLSSLLGGKSSSSSIGAKLLGGSNTSEDLLLGILNSRLSLINVINKYKLMSYYKIKENNMDKAIKAFQEDVVFEPNEYDFIEISVINKDPKKSAEIANYFVEMLDSLNIKINTENATNNRLFVEKRYNKNLSDLRNAEDSLYKFQKKHGIFAVPEQLEVSVKAAAELEATLSEREMESYFIKQQYGANSPQYLGLLTQIKMLKDKVNELKSSPSLSSASNVLFPFKEVPDMVIKYYRYYREIEIQSKILEFVLPMYEQAKVEEQKSIPTVMVIDQATPPQTKYAPKKAFIVLAFSFIAFFLLVIISFRGEYLSNLANYSNPLIEKENRFYSFLIKIYKVR